MFWPTLFLTIALILFLMFQVHSLWCSALQVKRQEKIITLQLNQLQSDMAQARTMQTMLDALVKDLLTMANTDPDIRQIVDKYQIRKTNITRSPSQVPER